MEKVIKTFKYFSEKGYKHYTENTVEELDKLPLNNHHIITEFAHLREWLRVNHGIGIYSSWGTYYDKTVWYYYISMIGKRSSSSNYERYNSPQEAYSAAFSYVLSKLI